MKKPVLLVLFFIAPVLCIFAGDKTFSLAAKFYAEGNFGKSAQLYQEIANKTEDPYAFYNLGNCYYRLNQKGFAVLNYYRAYKLLPRDADIRNNLSLLLAENGQSLVPRGMPDTAHKIIVFLSEREIKSFAWTLFWAGAILAVLSAFIENKKKFFAICSLVCALCAGGFYLFLHLRAQADANNLCVIMSDTALYGGPSENFPVSAALQQGYTAPIVGKADNGWLEIGISKDAVKAWVSAQMCRKI